MSTSARVRACAMALLRSSLRADSPFTCLCTPPRAATLFSVISRSFVLFRVFSLVLASLPVPSHGPTCFYALPGASARLVTPSRPPACLCTLLRDSTSLSVSHTRPCTSAPCHVLSGINVRLHAYLCAATRHRTSSGIFAHF